LVEDKAKGPAVIQSLPHEIGGLVEVNPEGGKMSRAARFGKLVWYLPHPILKQWVEGFITECATFPTGANDDQVDAGSQGLLHGSKPVPSPLILPDGGVGDRGWVV
jgi:predicted phage terminase large subunit-like protein